MRDLVCLLLVAALGFSVSGCNKRQEKKENTVLHAYRLIDAQRNEEAIELLEKQSAAEPDNVELRVVLASAYAHMGGVKVQRLVAAINSGDKLGQLSEPLPPVDGKLSMSEQSDRVALNIATLLVRASGIAQVYATVPPVSQQQAVYIQHAMDILEALGDKLKPEDAIYKAVLEVVLLKHFLAENFFGELSVPKIVNMKNCTLNVDKLSDAVVTVGKVLIDIFNDIGYANPQQAQQMKKQADDTANIVSNLTMFLTSAAVFDQASSVYLREVAFMQGFGKMVKCAGQ